MAGGAHGGRYKDIDEVPDWRMAMEEDRRDGVDPEPDDRYRTPATDPLRHQAPEPYPGGLM